ncbi:hypothetical protein ACGFZK_33605 [Streptomyces sp. NPDC048257]|uniref:hypothetical protein n=1 Tax=Streptomyces sp. NPDC048257 TaxID=3365526 RepID=UPI003716C780
MLLVAQLMVRHLGSSHRRVLMDGRTPRHDDLTTALITVVAAGGQGMAMLLERTS